MPAKPKPASAKSASPAAAGGVRIRRALLSCHDKTGLEAFAKTLAGLGVELIASGGTAEFLTKHRLTVKTVEAFAGIPAQLDGRVKTLHPKIHGGILARRDDAGHVKAVGEDGLIDLVVVNLYPFQETVKKPGVSQADAIEQIDIGGVALLRAAAKNFSGAAAVSNPRQYASVAEALREGRGSLPASLARRLSAEAFELTSNYDQAIAAYVNEAGSETVSASGVRAAGWPETTSITVKKRQRLRYGENPHQQGAWYVPVSGGVWGLGTLTQVQGKELSYNNLLDIDAALRVLTELEGPSCAIIKHNSQCGLATAANLEEAYDRAFACDSESAFGGIVGFNERITAKLANRLTSTFLEVILAPAVDADAVSVFGKKPNLRLVTLEWPSHLPAEPEWRQLGGSWLVQDANTATLDLLQLATKRAPTQQERNDLLFAWKAVKHAKSNGVVLVHGQATVGIGQGQPSRVGSVRLAIEKAGERARGSVAASDGFFPFPDSIELLAKAGVTAVIQPGGSIKDPEVIAAANTANVAMLMSGVRHFRH